MKEKAFNPLAQTGCAEDLLWAIVNDAETERHIESRIQDFKRDIRFADDEEVTKDIEKDIERYEAQSNNVRYARYAKQNTMFAMFDGKGDPKESCMFKHQALSFAETRDAKDANSDNKLQSYFDELFEKTANNFAFHIANFIGENIDYCMSCLFESAKINQSQKKKGE